MPPNTPTAEPSPRLAESRPADASGPRGKELVSVVVITFNRAGPLLDALRSVARLETAGEFDAELIVVDNASTDDTAGVVADFAQECPFPVRR
ncbi:MAG: glycosyltransferase, partial [Planctomycetota bacterium]